MKDHERPDEIGDYRYEENAEGHENQLEFDRDYATHEVLEDKGLIGEEQEEVVRRNLLQDEPGGDSDSAAEEDV